MNRPSRHPETTAALGALMALAIGLRLVLSGATMAASACTESLDRVGVRRLSESVVQAIREMSERAVASVETPPSEPTWAPTPARLAASAGLPLRADPGLGFWLTSLPPPRTV